MQDEKDRFFVCFEKPGEPIKGRNKRKRRYEEDESVIAADRLFDNKTGEEQENDETVFIGDSDLTELVKKDNNSDEMS